MGVAATQASLTGKLRKFVDACKAQTIDGEHDLPWLGLDPAEIGVLVGYLRELPMRPHADAIESGFQTLVNNFVVAESGLYPRLPDRRTCQIAALGAAAQLLERIESVQATVGGGSGRQPVAVSSNEAKILAYLLGKHPVPQNQYDISEGIDLSRGTLSRCLDSMRKAGHVHRPCGERGGEGLTDSGKSLAEHVALIAP